MSGHAAASEKEVTLGQRVAALEASLAEYNKRSVIVAIVAALLGTGGFTGVIGVWTGARLQKAEADLKSVQAELTKADLKYKDHEKQLNEEKSVLENRLKNLELAKQVHREITESLLKSMEMAIKAGNPQVVGVLRREAQDEYARHIRFLRTESGLGERPVLSISFLQYSNK